eukprot:GILJ01011352.1.p1 GENE.GILJ01011352.1~~GILJ01011352.1.p1  ORF type:complete len:113 (+),score=0.72 GILJ01011352.1:409-747(+)
MEPSLFAAFGKKHTFSTRTYRGLCFNTSYDISDCVFMCAKPGRPSTGIAATALSNWQCSPACTSCLTRCKLCVIQSFHYNAISGFDGLTLSLQPLQCSVRPRVLPYASLLCS